MTSYRQVVAISRGLEVLRAVSVIKGGTVGAIHERTGLDKATVVRILETLMQEGYVVRTGEPPRYEVTGKVTQLSSGFDRNRELARVSAPIFDKYRTELPWPLTVAVFDGDAMAIAEAIRKPRGLSVDRAAGYRFPLLVTSSGLAYIAFVPAHERKAILDDLVHVRDANGWNKRAEDPEAIEALCAQIRAQGYAVSDEEYYQEQYDGVLWAASVPIMNRQEVFAVFGIMLLTHVHPRGTGLENYLPLMKKVADEIAAGLTP